MIGRMVVPLSDIWKLEGEVGLEEKVMIFILDKLSLRSTKDIYPIDLDAGLELRRELRVLQIDLRVIGIEMII